MMTEASQPLPADLIVLHVLRVSGMADREAVAQRSGVDQDTVDELLGDYEAYGWATLFEFADTRGWALTDRGKVEDTQRLSAELAASGARDAVEQAHRAFDPLNARVVRACTDWQLRPDGDGHRLVANDHRDSAWDSRVLDELSAVTKELISLVGGLVGSLSRFDGYQGRFSSALALAQSGQVEWVAGVGVSSCHVVWMELHEDLLSTLGISRGAEQTGKN
jgi:hypothetical protein